jgi:hypothetical protein
MDLHGIQGILLPQGILLLPQCVFFCTSALLVPRQRYLDQFLFHVRISFYAAQGTILHLHFPRA